jgi:hypothetical protein
MRHWLDKSLHSNTIPIVRVWRVICFEVRTRATATPNQPATFRARGSQPTNRRIQSIYGTMAFVLFLKYTLQRAGASSQACQMRQCFLLELLTNEFAAHCRRANRDLFEFCGSKTANAKMCVDPEYLFKDYVTTESRLLFTFRTKAVINKARGRNFLSMNNTF